MIIWRFLCWYWRTFIRRREFTPDEELEAQRMMGEMYTHK